MISVALSKIVDGLKIPLNPPLKKGELEIPPQSPFRKGGNEVLSFDEGKSKG